MCTAKCKINITGLFKAKLIQERKGTLFNSESADCKLKSNDIKLRRGKPENPGKNLREQSRESTNSTYYSAESENRTGATCVEGECSHHLATIPFDRRNITVLRNYSDVLFFKILDSAAECTLVYYKEE